MWVLVCQAKPFGIFSKCNGKPLKVRSRKWCELIHILDHSGERASAEEERGRKRGATAGGHVPTYSHTLPLHPFHTHRASRESVQRDSWSVCRPEYGEPRRSWETLLLFLKFILLKYS